MPDIIKTIIAAFIISSCGLSPAAAQFIFPKNNQTFNSNIIIAIRVVDGQDINKLELTSAKNEFTQTLCENNCGASFNRTLTGINPLNLGLSPGEISLQLVAHNNSGNINQIDSVTFNWQPQSISGVQINRQPGTLTVSWSPINTAFRYNLYIASEENITPANIANKADNQVFRAINGTSMQVSGFEDQQGLFALVTAIDATGENAFSDEIRIPAFNNQPPIAVNDNFSVAEDSPLQDNIQKNDSDPEQSQLTSRILSSPVNGRLTLQTNGEFTYQPNSNFNGVEQFTYELIDSANGIDQGLVTIRVTAVNDAPQANENSYTLQEDTNLSIDVEAGVLSNDTDIDSPASSLQATLVTATRSGEVGINANGSFNYVPKPNFFGEDSFVYQVSDELGATAEAKVTLNISNINDPPQANSDSYQTNEDVPLVADGSINASVLDNDTDADLTADNTQELTASLINSTSKGQLNFNTDGKFSYIPNPNVSGSDSFRYQITDSGGLTSQANVNINIIAVNDPPVAQGDSYSLDEDTTLSVAANLGVLSNDADPDSSTPLAASIKNAPNLGTVDLASDGSFTYVPNQNSFGEDGFSYTVTDTLGASASGNVLITIKGINDAPIAKGDEVSTGLNQSITIDVLSNDSDPDKDTLTISSATSNNGTVAISNNAIVFTPESNFFGVATINYTISDIAQLTASAQVKVNVATGIPLAANDDLLTTDEDIAATINVLSNDTGSGIIRVTSARANLGTVAIGNNGLLTYTPTSNVNGTDIISYSIIDISNETANAQVKVTINSVPDAPVANNDTITTALDTSVLIPVLNNDTDGDRDILSITSATTTTGNVEIQGQQLVYTPPSGFSGQASIDYSISDGNSGTDSAVVVVTVTASQLLANNDSVVTPEDTSININVLANDSGDANLTVSDVTVSQGSVDIENDKTLTYTPPANLNGNVSFTYFISDGSGESASAGVSVTITPVNDAPVSVADSYILTSTASITVPSAAGVLDNDTDIESNSMTASLVTSPSYASSFTLNTNGSFTYQHDGSNNLADSFSYRASDTDAGNVVTVALTIAKPNTPAQLCNLPPLSIQSGQSLSFNLQANNPDADSLSYSASGLPSWLSLSGNTLSGTPNDSHITTTNNIQLSVTDGKDPHALSNIQLTVFDDFGSSNIKDFSFGSVSGNSRVADMTLDRKGNIVAVGHANDSGDVIAVARFKPNGVLDTSFSGDGIYTLDLDYSFDETATAVVVDKNNNIYVSAYGSEDATNSDNDFYLLKFKPDGTPDSSFSGDGRASFEILADKTDQAMDLVLHSDGDITLVGHTQVASGNSDIALVHVNPDGTIDSSFGNSGKLTFSQTNNQFAYAGLLDNKGHIYVTGSHNNGTDDDILLLRTKETGLDSAFNNNTGTAYNLSASNAQIARDIIFDARGNLLVAGSSNNDFAIYSFALNASQVPFLNTSAFTGGKRIQDLGDTDLAYKIVADRIHYYAVGVTGTSPVKTAIIKLNTDGTLDTSYASSGIYIDSSATGNSGDRAAALLNASGQLITAAGQAANTRLRLHTIANYSEFSCNLASQSSGATKTLDLATSASKTSSGQIYLAGESTNPADSQKDFLLTKLTAEGEPDISFANGGILRHDSSSGSSSLTLTHVLTDSNAGPFLIGYAATDKIYIAKYKNNGTLDTGFSDDGVNDFGSGDVRLVTRSAEIDTSNNIYLAGIQASKATLMKITPSGGVDLSFASGVPQVEYADTNFNVLDMVRVNDGSIYLVGEHTGNARLAIVKYTSTGVLDSSFGSSGFKEIATSSASKGIAVASNGSDLYILTQKNTDDVEIRKFNSNGNPVNSFGTNGVLDLPGYKSHVKADIQYLSPDGRLLVQVKNSSAQNVLLKLKANGDFKKTFINAGVATYTHNLSNWETVSGFLQLNSGNLLIYGRENDDMAVSMMLANGQIVNQQNELLIDGGFGHSAYAVTLDLASRILIAGDAYNTSNNTQDFAYARFNFDGTADTSLTGSSAIQITADAGAQHESYRDILVTATSQVQVSGQAFSTGSPTDHNLKGLRTQPASVATDNSYAGGGFNLDLASVSNDKINAHLLLSDGSLLMVGSLNNQGVIVKLNSSGLLDNSFGAGGIKTLSLGDSSLLNALTIDAEGKIIAVGETTSSGNVSAFAVRFVAETGVLDTGFDSDGIAILNLSSLDYFQDVAITSEGKYVAVGSSNQQTLIAQFQKDGSKNTSFNSTGYITNDLGENDQGSAVLLDNYGAILVSSQTSSSNILLRYDNSGNQLLLAEHYTSGILNHIHDLTMDHQGNAYITGKMQIDGLWKFFVIKFNAVASPF